MVRVTESKTVGVLFGVSRLIDWQLFYVTVTDCTVHHYNFNSRKICNSHTREQDCLYAALLTKL